MRFQSLFVHYIVRLIRTCGENLSHIIADEKDDEHVLIRHGIYAYLRHPSYFGWFYWSVGTQLILCNPVCTVLYAMAAWYFFSSRIPYEEYMLHDFFGEEYISSWVISINHIVYLYESLFFVSFLCLWQIGAPPLFKYFLYTLIVDFLLLND